MSEFLLYIVVLLTASFIISEIYKRKFNLLSNENKLKLIEITWKVRRLTTLIILISSTFFYLISKLELFDITYPLLFTTIIIMICSSLYSKLLAKKAEIPTDFYKGNIAFKLLFIILIIATSIILTLPPSEKKTYWDYQTEAQKETDLKHFDKAIQLYDEAILLDSTNANCYYNRGCCIYFIHDKEGACLDWKIASRLGEKEANVNLTNFCK